MNSLVLPVEKREDFLTPEGFYQAEVKTVFTPDTTSNNDSDKKVRIKWRILNPSFSTFEYVIAKNYLPSLKAGSALRTDLEQWLGHQGFDKLAEGKAVNLQALVGLPADVEVTHSNRGREKPFVSPTRICAPGTLIKAKQTGGFSICKVPTEMCAHHPFMRAS